MTGCLVESCRTEEKMNNFQIDSIIHSTDNADCSHCATRQKKRLLSQMKQTH